MIAIAFLYKYHKYKIDRYIYISTCLSVRQALSPNSTCRRQADAAERKAIGPERRGFVFFKRVCLPFTVYGLRGLSGEDLRG